MLLLQYLDDIETYKELKGKGDTKGMKEPKKRNYIILTGEWKVRDADMRNSY